MPASVYVEVSVGYAELEEKIGGTSKLADYLISQLVEWNATFNREPIESRSLGDSPAISLILFPRGGTFRTVPAPRFGQEGHYIPGSGKPDQGLRVGRRPLPAGRHVRQDPQVRPHDRSITTT